MKKLVGFTGRMRAGKSTAAETLVRCGYARASFAGGLKHMLRCLLAYRGVPADEIERMVAGDLKERPVRSFLGQTPRYAMRTLGTEWGRQCVSPAFWVDTELAHVTATAGRHVVFDDVRFPEEVEGICSRGGLIIRIRNAEAEAAPVSHASEAHALTLFAHREIWNDGSIEDLRRQVIEAVRDIY